MRPVVQKFGGTSLATAEARGRALARIRAAREEGWSPVVVLSAIGRSPDPYATDSLLSLVAPFDGARDPREVDLLLSCGELISCVLMSHMLRREGLAAEALSGLEAGIFTDGAFGEARIKAVDPGPVREVLDRGAIPVVAGFQGVNDRLQVTTLGRGGSDTTAVALGIALGAERVEIYTDVEGVMTADPRLFPGARVLSRVSFEELGEMAWEGARIVHPRAVQLARQRAVPVWIRSTFSEAPGTLVTESLEQPRLVSGVAHRAGLSQVAVDLSGKACLGEARDRLLEALAARRVSLDLVNLAEERVWFIVEEDLVEAEVRPALEGFSFRVRPGCAKLSVVGLGMRGVPGVMARVHGCLRRAGVEILHSTDSHVTLSCLVPERDLAAAVEAVHREFGL